MDRQELRFRLSSAVRRESARVAFAARRPAWHRESLMHAIRRDDPLLGPALPELERRDWLGAHRRLMHQIAAGSRRFILDATDRAARVEMVRSAFPAAISDADARADEILEGRFDLLGYTGLSFSKPDDRRIDWHLDPIHHVVAPRGYWSRIRYLQPEYGDHKIIWELNRHQHWMLLGRAYWLSKDRRYRAGFIDQFESWMSQNAPLDGINWASMLELGLRSLSWLWALHLFVEPDGAATPDDEIPWTVDLLLGLDRQMSLVEQNLSQYFSPNTHLLGEALALYVVGRALPGLKRAGAWESTGRSALLEQTSRQICADGGHAELSTHYHRYTLDFYLLALSTARHTGDPAASDFSRAVQTLARFARTIADDRGRVPTIGDEDGGRLFPICGREPRDLSDSLQLAAHLLRMPALAVGAPAEEVVWMTGQVPAVTVTPPAWPSAAFPDSGYYVSRFTTGDHLTIDGGPHGFLNGGHAHADALAVALSVGSQPLLIDPGTGCYTIDPEVRDRFRSTRFHNTLTLDGRSQSTPDGPFHWRSTASASAADWQRGGTFDYFEGTHDGYAPLIHHRAILSRPGRWAFIDRIRGEGLHRADLHWHLDPSWRITRSGRTAVRAEHDDGTVVWILTPETQASVEVVRGATAGARLGWCAPVYGPLVPTSTIQTTVESNAPFTIVTLIVESHELPEVDMLSVEDPADMGHHGTLADPREHRLQDAVGFRIRTSTMAETMMFTRPLFAGSTREVAPRRWRAGGIETDARVLCWRESSDRHGEAIVMIDGSTAERVGRESSGDAARRGLEAASAIG